MAFLALALGLIVVGVVFVVLRNRRPTGIDAGIEDFEARRRALASDEEQPEPRGGRGLG